MRNAAFLTALPLLPAALLSGCAAADGRPARPDPAPQPQACTTEGLDAFVGRIATAESGAALLAASGARSLRWAAPGSALTMDFRPDRLTVSYDRAMRITRLSCG